jgi:uncharacterized protein YeaO (DUF488 family)
MFVVFAAAALAITGGARAEDIETLGHHIYRSVTVTRVEPDGIVVNHSAGIVKIPFVELNDDLQRKYHYEPDRAAEFKARIAREQQELTAQSIAAAHAAADKQRQTLSQAEKEAAQRQLRAAAEKALPASVMHAGIKPFSYGERSTTAWIYPAVMMQTGHHNEGLNWVPTMAWQISSEHFIGVIDQAMPQNFEDGSTAAVVTLYKIGHTADSARHPLFTLNRERAVEWLMDQQR